jgi:hypothetical protein
MRHHVTPPISAHHDLNRDNFEPNIDSVGTPPKRPRADRRIYPKHYRLLPRPAPPTARPSARRAGRARPAARQRVRVFLRPRADRRRRTGACCRRFRAVGGGASHPRRCPDGRTVGDQAGSSPERPRCRFRSIKGWELGVLALFAPATSLAPAGQLGQYCSRLDAFAYLFIGLHLK